MNTHSCILLYYTYTYMHVCILFIILVYGQTSEIAQSHNNYQNTILVYSLTTLLLHSNHLSDLPYNVNQLRRLSTLVVAFNKFFELPQVVKELPSLKILIASGNHIR